MGYGSVNVQLRWHHVEGEASRWGAGLMSQVVQEEGCLRWTGCLFPGFAAGSTLRIGVERVDGPGVSGITLSEFFSDFRVGVGPEAGEIVRNLLRSPVGGEEVEEYRDASPGYPGGLGEAKHLLDAYREDWSEPIRSIGEADKAPAGDFDSCRRVTVERGPLLIGECALDKLGE